MSGGSAGSSTIRRASTSAADSKRFWIAKSSVTVRSSALRRVGAKIRLRARAGRSVFPAHAGLARVGALKANGRVPMAKCPHD